MISHCQGSFSHSFIPCLPMPNITNWLVISDPAAPLCPAATPALPAFQPPESSPPSSHPFLIHQLHPSVNAPIRFHLHPARLCTVFLSPLFRPPACFWTLPSTSSSSFWCLVLLPVCCLLLATPRLRLLFILACFFLMRLGIKVYSSEYLSVSLSCAFESFQF